MNYLQLIRPFNLLFVLVSVFCGAIYLQPPQFTLPILFAMLSACFIAAAGYAINDYFDVDIDKINKPHRVIASGKIPPYKAFHFAILLFLIGIFLSFCTAQWINVFIAITNSLLLFFYAKKFKLQLIIGNIVVAISSASTFIYGGFANQNFHPSLVIAIFAFLYTLIRELVKDMEDHQADRIKKANTIPIRMGLRKSVFLMFFPLISMFLYLLFLFACSSISITTFLLMHVVILIPITLSLFILLKKNHTLMCRKTATFMKVNMLSLLLILVLGK